MHDAIAVAGFRCQPRSTTAVDHLTSLAAFLTAFCLADPGRTSLQARLSIIPTIGGLAAVDSALLVGAKRGTSADAIKTAEKFACDMQVLHRRDTGFALTPLASAREVEQVMNPFPLTGGAELGIREDPVGRLGGSVRARPAWHMPPFRPWPALVANLDQLRQPVTLAVNLRPTRLSPAELACLDDLHQLQALREAPVAATLLRQHEASGGTTFFDRDPALIPLFPPPLFEATMWIGAGGDLSNLTYGGILAAFAAEAASQWRWRRMARPADAARLCEALTAVATTSILEPEGDSEGARLPRLFTADAAARLVPLPTGDTETGDEVGLRRLYPRRYAFGPRVMTTIATPELPAAPLVIGQALASEGRLSVTRQWDDLRRHTYIVGQTGTGKSSLIGRMALQDMAAGRAVLIVDPTGDLVEDLLGRIPAHRRQDVIVVDPTDERRPLGLNILDARDPGEFRRAVTEFIGTLYKVYDPHRTGMVGPRLENMFRCSLLAAQAVAGEATLLEVYRLLVDRGYEQWLAQRVSDPFLKRYFDELAMTSDFHRSETVGYFSSKLGRFAADPQLRAVLCQPSARWSLAAAIDSGKIVLVTLRQGQLGPETSGFLGGIVMTKLMLATFARDGQSIADRAPLSVYLDEFQTYATDDAIARMLAGIRKYNVAVTLANQHIHQLEPGVREAIFGNAGTIISLRLGANDAPLLAEALKPGDVTAGELVALPNFVARVSMLERGERLPVFDLATLPLPDGADPCLAEALRAQSAHRYGRDRAEVDHETARRLAS